MFLLDIVCCYLVLCVVTWYCVLLLGIVCCYLVLYVVTWYCMLLQVIVGSRERKELQKLLKARDLPEYTTFAEKPEEEEIETRAIL